MTIKTMKGINVSERAVNTWIYWLARFGAWVWLRVKLGFTVSGYEQVPGEGGCIIACNHVSYLDPPMLSCGIPHRIVHFLARDTLFDGPIKGWFMRNVRCIPIDRTRGDVGALRKALSCLKEGKVLALFPEGTRSPDGQLQPAKGGIGFLIAKAGVPVVPARVFGSYEAHPKGSKKVLPGKVRLVCGPAILPEEFAQFGQDRAAYDEIGRLVMSRIAELK